MKDFATVRAAIGGLKGLMKRLGDAPDHDHKWKVMPACPFCGHKDSAGVFTKGGVDYFKCHYTGCNSGGTVMTEVSYLAAREGLSETKPADGPSPAYKRLLELAGCWEEPKAPAKPKAPSPKPKVKPKDEPARPNPLTAAASPAPAPVPPPVPPAPPVLPNPVLPLTVEVPVPPAPTPEPVLTGAAKDNEQLVRHAIEVVRVENKASVELLRRVLHLGYGRALALIEELEKRGIVGPADGNQPRAVLKLPDKPSGLIAIKIGDEIHIEEGGPLPAAMAGPAGPPLTNTPAPVAEDKVRLPLGMAALRWLYERLEPTEMQMVPYLESGEPVPGIIPAAMARKLKFKPAPLFERRGLTTVTCLRAGLRANPPANEAVLQELSGVFPWEEARAAGVWLEANRKAKLGRRTNAQFHGKGQIGKKPDKERKGKDDKWVWGFCEPVLIPFFDEAGDLIKLRPHKGGAPAGTVAGRPRIYVPRDYRHCGDIVEKFYTAVICEGEYKALAIWQHLGLGALIQTKNGEPDGEPTSVGEHFEPVGVCALPGISYVTNKPMRRDLERWLKEVGARRVLVAFDDEDKSDKPMRQRFDAQRDARVLAVSLAKELHVEARVCMLPREWRNAHGKADWDGALVRILSLRSLRDGHH